MFHFYAITLVIPNLVVAVSITKLKSTIFSACFSVKFENDRCILRKNGIIC